MGTAGLRLPVMPLSPEPLSSRLTTHMRLFLLAGLWVVSASDGGAQDAGAPPDSSRRGEGLVFALSGSLLVAPGELGETTGALHGGARGFAGFQATPRLALDLSAHVPDRHEETIRLSSGLDAGVKTTSDIGRIALLGRYGPRFGTVHTYGEALVGTNVLSTRSSSGSSSQDNLGETQKESIVPAAGIGVGIEVGLGELPLAVHARASHVFGGNAEYLIYDEAEKIYVERSSSTTTSSFSIGLTYNFFQVTSWTPW